MKMQCSFYLTRREKKELMDIAEATETTYTQVIRNALHMYYNCEHIKKIMHENTRPTRGSIKGENK